MGGNDEPPIVTPESWESGFPAVEVTLDILGAITSTEAFEGGRKKGPSQGSSGQGTGWEMRARGVGSLQIQQMCP